MRPAAVQCGAGQFVPAAVPSSGLFVDDYSRLPRPTGDVGRAKRDIDKFGYCLLKAMLTPAECSALATRILEQAHAEEALAARDADAAESLRQMKDMPQWRGVERNQNVRSLHNKGDEIISLLENDTMLEVVRHVIGRGFQANFLNCEVAKPGSSARDLHTDQ